MAQVLTRSVYSKEKLRSIGSREGVIQIVPTRAAVEAAA